MRANAVRLSERFLAESNAQVQSALLKHVDDRHWLVREQLAPSLGTLPAGARETALTSLLERHADDPVLVDAALSGLRGSEATVLANLLKSTETSPARETAITMLTATVVRSAQSDVFTVLASSRHTT